MDIAAHNVTLEWIARGGRGSKYAHFIFLNSSVRGPFVPMFMPPGWQWTLAFTTRLSATTKVSVQQTPCLQGLATAATTWSQPKLRKDRRASSAMQVCMMPLSSTYTC